MTTSNVPRVLVRAGERGPDFPSGHPYNPSAEVHGWLLSRPAGLARIAVNAAFLRPGKESAIFHVHYREEEWMYVLSGRGIAEVDGAEHGVGPGDFLGFAPGVGHHLRNPSGEELHYLVGGEVIADVEVGDFPKVRRRAVFYRSRFAVYPMDAEVPFMPPEAEQALAALLGSPPVVEPARALVRAVDHGEPRRYQHAENPLSETHVVQLSRMAGLRRVAVNLARVPAGRESYVFHLHHAQEEWMYVLSGRGIAEVGEAEHGWPRATSSASPPAAPRTTCGIRRARTSSISAGATRSAAWRWWTTRELASARCGSIPGEPSCTRSSPDPAPASASPSGPRGWSCRSGRGSGSEAAARGTTQPRPRWRPRRRPRAR